MRDIPIVPDGPGLIAYLEILERVLVPPPAVIAQARAAERGKGGERGASNDLHVDRNKMPRPGSKDKGGLSLEAKGVATGLPKSSSSSSAVKDKDSPVSVLLTVIRKALHSFIVADDTMESAWMCLLKAFRRFDPSETGTVAPRDFCLAVSVLLGGDEVLLNSDAWREVIEHFSYKDEKKSARASSRVTGGSDKDGGALQVDYMQFCGTILETTAKKEFVGSAKNLGARATSSAGDSKPKGSATLGSQSRDRARALTKR